MNIIFSPAKTFNLKKSYDVDWSVGDKTVELVNVLSSLSTANLQSILKISDKLVEENKSYINGFHDGRSYRAIEMYNGMAYKSLDYKSLDSKSVDYLCNTLYILSAFYGLIRPFDYIKPYRLDFNVKLKVGGISLKNYWKSYYNSVIPEGESILNLASNEFSELFDKSNYRWYDFDFFEIVNGEKKRHSTISKKGRGRLLRELAINEVYSIEEIKSLRSYGTYFELI